MSSKLPRASAKQFSKMKKHPAGSSAAASWTDGSGRLLLIGVVLRLLLAAIAGQLRVVAPRALEDCPDTSNELAQRVWFEPGHPATMASASISCKSISDCPSNRGRPCEWWRHARNHVGKYIQSQPGHAGVGAGRDLPCSGEAYKEV